MHRCVLEREMWLILTMKFPQQIQNSLRGEFMAEPKCPECGVTGLEHIISEDSDEISDV